MTDYYSEEGQYRAGLESGLKDRRDGLVLAQSDHCAWARRSASGVCECDGTVYYSAYFRGYDKPEDAERYLETVETE